VKKLLHVCQGCRYIQGHCYLEKEYGLRKDLCEELNVKSYYYEEEDACYHD